MNDFLTEASFWVPDRLTPSGWLEHAPFAFWLIEAHKPRVLVELGSHTGYSYLAFCQAIQKLGLKTRAHAVDTWQGDEHAGFYGEEVFQELKEYHQPRYAAFSRLIRSTFDDALAEFEDGSIDLLHIDGRHFYEDVKHDFEVWFPKLSGRGIVLFHDTQVRERGFGVFKLWEDVVQKYPHFEFVHGHGLGVLGTGRQLPQLLSQLFAASADEHGADQVRLSYSRLGGALSDRLGNQEAAVKVSEHQDTLELSKSHSRNLQAALVASHKNIVQLEKSIVTLQTNLEHAGRELNARSLHVAKLEQLIAAAESDIDNLTNDLQAITDRVAHSEQNAAIAHSRSEELEKELEFRLNEVAELEAVAIVAQNKKDALEASIQSQSKIIAELKCHINSSDIRTEKIETLLYERDAVVAKLATELNALKTSISWRLTTPIRKISNGIRNLFQHGTNGNR
ncbi:MAG: class I SAM-dependent methyltransferase [Nitrospirota bacterium]|nr:class I SAM-dependent methyltransferase [Nitrospirota bacterium]